MYSPAYLLDLSHASIYIESHCRKEQADKFVRRGKIRTAGLRYRLIWALYDVCPIFHLDANTYNSNLAELFGILSAIIVMAAIMDAFIDVRIGEICNQNLSGQRLAMILALEDRVRSLSKFARTKARLPKALMEWHMVLCNFLTVRSEWSLTLALIGIRKLASDLDKGNVNNNLRRFVGHDLSLIEKCVSDDAVIHTSLSIYLNLTDDF